MTVSEGRDGSLQVFYGGRQVKCREIAAPPARPKPKLIVNRQAVEIRKKLHRPASHHPWKRCPAKLSQPALEGATESPHYRTFLRPLQRRIL